MIKRKALGAILLCAIGWTSVAAQQGLQNLDPAIEHKIDSVLGLMTLHEKVGQMNQYSGGFEVTGEPSDVNTQAKIEMLKKGELGSMLNVLGAKSTREYQELVMENSRMKIPLLFGYDVIHGYKTIMPVPLGETASWDLEAMRESAEIAARESAAAGLHWTFAPMIDVSRDARWGRIMEGAGEDPYLVAKAGEARIKGFQGDDLTSEQTIAACAKHFAAYGFAEAGRDYNTVNMGTSELYNSVLYPFIKANEAGVATFMNSFNEIDGVPSTGNEHLQRYILKGEWGFNGFMVSDWGSIAELIVHGFAKDSDDAAKIAAVAGSDMDLEGHIYEASLEKMVDNGTVPVEIIDDAVRRILRVKFALGLFDDPYKYCDEDFETSELGSQENLAKAREVARKSIVLLKNENNILPLKKDVKSIAVIGPLADDKDSPIGNWRAQGEKNSAVSVLEGIKAAVSKKTKINYAKGADHGMGERSFLMPLKINKDDESGFAEAVNAAKKSDVVVMVLGEDAFQTGEGRSQVDIQISQVQRDLLKAVKEVNDNIVLVLMNGRPLDIVEPSNLVNGVLETWFLGSESGNAIADVLFGDYNPSGKLPVSFPRSVGQEPLYYNQKTTGRPASDMVTYSGYQDSERDAFYPFGFGLSYTDFAYSEIKLDATSFNKGESLKATVTVTNNGDRAGREVVQLYIHDKFASRTRPVKELRDFAIVELEPGESKEVTFTIDEETLEFYSAMNKWEAESGEFDIFIGTNSVDNQRSTITLN